MAHNDPTAGYVVSGYYPRSETTYYFHCPTWEEAEALTSRMDNDNVQGLRIDALNVPDEYGTGAELSYE